MHRTPAEIPTRSFGKTGQRISCIGLGGWHLGVPESDEAAIRLVHTAIAAGVTFLDNAWDYNDGVPSRTGGTRCS
jgi:aryl-alcohol dehydrogenase-like predicted oxidoreductase